MKTGVFHSRVAHVVAELDDVDPKHRRQGVRPTTPLSLKVVGPDALLQPLPGNKGVDSLQKHLPTGLSLLVLVLQVGKGWLLRHGRSPLVLASLSMPQLQHYSEFP